MGSIGHGLMNVRDWTIWMSRATLVELLLHVFLVYYCDITTASTIWTLLRSYSSNNPSSPFPFCGRLTLRSFASSLRGETDCRKRHVTLHLNA